MCFKREAGLVASPFWVCDIMKLVHDLGLSPPRKGIEVRSLSLRGGDAVHSYANLHNFFSNFFFFINHNVEFYMHSIKIIHVILQGD